MALNITITDAGRAELINADNTGTAPVTITQVAFTATAFTPSKTQTSLPGEARRLASIAGEVVAPDTISVTAKDEGSQPYTVRGFGLITDRGTLFAVYGQADPIIEKAGPSTLLLTVDVVLADIDAALLKFGDISFSNPPASTTTPGVVTLSNATDSNAQNQAATPRAVKAANDNANTRLAKSQNLADLVSAAAARVNLGLGASATMGTTALRTSSSTTVLLQAAAMNDHRTSGDHDARYPQRGNNLSDLPSPSQARKNLGLGASATMGTTAQRTSTATDIVLQAKAMNDHRQSDDHDDRYARPDVENTWTSSQRFKSLLLMEGRNGAYSRSNARDEGKNTRIHSYSTDTDGKNAPYLQAWYGGSAYTQVTTTDNGVEFDKELTSSGFNLPNGVSLKGASSGLEISRSAGSVSIGNRNSSYTHYSSSAGKHYFYGEVHAQSGFYGDGSNLTGTAKLRATGTTKDDVGLDNVQNRAFNWSWGKGTPTHFWASEGDATHSYVYTAAAVKAALSITKADVGLSELPNLAATSQDTANTLMARNSSGDTWARLFRSSYAYTNSSIAGIYTTQQIGADFIRPSTPAQVRDAIGAYHPGNIAEAFPRTGGEIGIQRLPNGLIIQYGFVDYVDFADERLIEITYNTTFPRQGVHASAFVNSSQASVSVTQRNFTNRGVIFVIKEFDQIIAGGRLYWFAIGY